MNNYYNWKYGTTYIGCSWYVSYEMKANYMYVLNHLR